MGLFSRLLGLEAPQESLRAASYIVLDVETTGLSPSGDRVIEIAVVRLSSDGSPIDEWTTLLDPEGPVGATHIHGITQSDVEGQPLFRALAPQLAEILGSSPIVAHNATFDVAFLRSEFERAGWDAPALAMFCTLKGSYDYFPNLDRRRLADCCWAAGVQLEHAHSALHDARATAALFARYLAQDPQLGIRLTAHSVVRWPAGPARDAAPWVPRQSGDPRSRFTAPRPVGPALIKQLSKLSLAEVIEEGAPLGSIAYIETLFTALEDGELSAAESQQLAALSYVYELTESDVDLIHRAFVLALAHRALDDGHVSRVERAELHHFASAIGVSSDVVVALIAQADAARSHRMSAGLGPLPDDWRHGDPLRVGDKVVFTGCDDRQRVLLEERAESLGVRVVGNVSRQTAMLVTDGGFHGTKAAKAAELAIRLVHPDVFSALLDHLQPAQSQAHPVQPAILDREISPSTVLPVLSGSTQAGSRGAAPSVVRAWALDNGIEVGVRGRLHADVFDAYWLSRVAETDSAGQDL